MLSLADSTAVMLSCLAYPRKRQKLQMVQNAAVCVPSNTRKRAQIMAIVNCFLFDSLAVRYAFNAYPLETSQIFRLWTKT